MSETFETLCHEALPDLYSEYRLTELPAQWWYKHHEIDVVAPTDQGTLIVGEANFTNTPVGYDVLAKLEKITDHMTGKLKQVIIQTMNTSWSVDLDSNPR